MTITELEAIDAAFRRHLHDKAIADLEYAINTRERQHAPTGALRRHLAALKAEGMHR